MEDSEQFTMSTEIKFNIKNQFNLEFKPMVLCLYFNWLFNLVFTLCQNCHDLTEWAEASFSGFWSLLKTSVLKLWCMPAYDIRHVRYTNRSDPIRPGWANQQNHFCHVQCYLSIQYIHVIFEASDDILWQMWAFCDIIAFSIKFGLLKIFHIKLSQIRLPYGIEHPVRNNYWNF